MVDSETNGGAQRMSRWRLVPWAIAAFLLLLPLVAMAVGGEVHWDETDFLVMGAMLFAACGAFELAARMSASTAYRAGAGIGVLAAFLLIWINLAVGIIGNEGNPANLMYFGVLAVGLAGALIVRFRPAGLARALVTMALAQGLIAVITLAAGLGSDGANWPQVIFVLNGLFAALWLASAWLFAKAARENMSPHYPRAELGGGNQTHCRS